MTDAAAGTGVGPRAVAPDQGLARGDACDDAGYTGVWLPVARRKGCPTSAMIPTWLDEPMRAREA